jgi:sterol desaturase/sphingolipid hydroxylase (fatty acid hydroxylase superfamily)
MDLAGRRARPVSIGVGLFMSAALVLLVAGVVASRSTVASFFTPAGLHAAITEAWHGFAIGVLNPWYWGFLVVLCALQWLFPARRDQRTPTSIELAADAVWFVMSSAMQVTVVALLLAGLTVADTQVARGWSLDLQPRIGFWGLALFAFVASDLLTWVAHWTHHMVPTLWRFHMVHHSQMNLNVLSDNRQHLGETVVTATLVFLPSQLLGLNADAAGTLAFLTLFWGAIIHANIRTNFGPLRRVLISPQAHRVHHSDLYRHYNTNFGSVFSIWDHIAGTIYRGYDEYPTTGIDDRDFPLEQRRDDRPWRLVAVWWSQTVYPFQAIVRLWTGEAERTGPAAEPAMSGARRGDRRAAPAELSST